ncbi:AmmeMemoRadiSam system protein B [Maribacter sp. TH_r10]|uniref:AmmeMemoRadiSam system protein B n=1 Tax=Maribacter sp. TH_r10 TaxID=3082086 RepID=UPI002954B45D|nr:AmmeMemoRadiSam system protein B [Maribacter sp. TH_r10]MDV7140445.1 AmmeMemoRadiSam system protein B [Maribacter sp. TH_r10]
MRLLLIICLCCLGCKNETWVKNNVQDQTLEKKVRQVHDTIGFTKYNWQLDTIYNRLGIRDSINNLQWKAAICPHDDYKYAGRLYYESLRGINANTIILVGVAHRARNFSLQDKIIFGDFTHWESPYGDLKVSDLNAEIIDRLPKSSYLVHNDMQALEHSLEAIVPFLHRKNKNLEIIPILVPYLNYETIDRVSDNLSSVISKMLKEKNLEYGKDVAVVISNDAVHYGNEEWSGDLAPFGVDDEGTKKARALDKEIIGKCLVNEISNEKVKTFTEYTVQTNDYKEYKWVWCGRYSVPFGLGLANKLNLALHNKPLTGTFLDYETSIDHDLINVEDLGMGTTAIATQKHWVAYASIKYE